MSVTNQRLRHVVALAEHLNFARAAEALHITQPALSRSILTLEQTLGARLFDRHSRGIEPTVFGKLVARRAAEILRRVSEMEREVNLIKGHDVGEVHIGAGPILAANHIGRTIGRVSRAHPNIKMVVRVGNWDELNDALHTGDLDVFVGEYTQATGNPVFAITPLAPRRFVFFARAGHPLAGTDRVSFADLQRFPLASPRIPERIELLLKQADAGDAWWGSYPHQPPMIECESYAVIKSVVASSDAVSAAPGTIIADEVRDGTLTRLPVALPDIHTSFGIVVRSERTLSPAAATFIEHLVAWDEANG